MTKRLRTECCICSAGEGVRGDRRDQQPRRRQLDPSPGDDPMQQLQLRDRHPRTGEVPLGNAPPQDRDGPSGRLNTQI